MVEERGRAERSAAAPTPDAAPTPGAAPTAGTPHRPAERRGDAWVLAAVTAAAYVLYAVLQWRRLEAPSWDLGIFTQLARAYAALEAPVVPIKGVGFNLLGDHFHPLLVVLGPLYRLWPSGLSLLVLQALLLAVSVVPLTRVAQEMVGRRLGLALGVSYALSWGLQGALAAQFHEIALAVPLLAAALAAVLRRRWWAAALWSAPTVFVKEDLGLTVALLGVVILWRGRDAVARRAGSSLTAWGIAWFVLATMVILPALNPRGQWDYTDNLGVGDSGPVALLVELVTPGEKLVTALLLLAVGGVVAVRSPLALLVLPTLAWRFLGDVPHYWGWTWHYSAVLMPVVVAALLDGARRRADSPRQTVGATEPADGRAAPPAHHGWAAAGVAVSLITSMVLLPTMPLATLAAAQSYRLPERHAAAEQVLAAVPEGATVATDISLMAYLVPRATVYWLGNPGNPPPDVVVIDRRGATWSGNPPADAGAHAESRHPGTSYRTVMDVDGYQVAERTDHRAASSTTGSRG